MNLLNWQEALERLKEGNLHFVADKLDGKLQNSSRRNELISGQHPSAIILSCSDSRVVPEFAFDTGLGELFVIRVAGNVANISSLASIEYAVAHLNVKLIIVLGHESCGAITAALGEHEGEEEKNFRHLFRYIEPAMRAVKEKTVNNIVKKNAELTGLSIYNNSKIIQKEVDNNQVKIISAYYHLDSGKVDFDE
ncbi:MAG: carbonic anhydrase [Bacteroidota bacterium]